VGLLRQFCCLNWAISAQLELGLNRFGLFSCVSKWQTKLEIRVGIKIAILTNQIQADEFIESEPTMEVLESDSEN